MNKCCYEKNEVVYQDNYVSTHIYLVQKGYVKLYADNDLPFAAFRDGSEFGDIEVILNLKRNGTARTICNTLFYKISKSSIEELFKLFPDIRE